MNTIFRLQHLLKSAVKRLFHTFWSTEDVPEENQLKHNFKDGQGKVNAYPYEEVQESTEIYSFEVKKTLSEDTNELTDKTDIENITTKTELSSSNENLTNSNSITNLVSIPNPIVLQIINEVPDKIEKIIPKKTQALPGQNFLFEIVFVKNYYYMEGDILPSYGVLSSDGKTLTVNSDIDLSIRLILAPKPQDWSKEQQDPTAKQYETDKLLQAIPQDGLDSSYSFENATIEDYFNVITFKNDCSTLLTSPTNHTPTIRTNTNIYDFTFKYGVGYDHNDILITTNDENVTWDYFTYDNKDYTPEQPIPSDYIKLSYIENTTDCYIDTGIKILNTDTVEVLANVKSSTSTSYKVLFGARQSSFVNNFFFFTRMNSQARACYARCNQEIWASSMTYGTDIKVVAKSNTLEIFNLDTEETLHTINVTGTACETTPVTCYIFDGNNNGNRDNSKCEARLYSFKVLDEENNVKYHFIPAKRKSDLAIGLYEVKTKTFVSSKSSNTFSYQPINTDDTRIRFKNITKDTTITISKNPMYDNPTQLIEEDEIVTLYKLLNATIEDYFWYVQATNQASDYMSVDTTYRTLRVGADSYYILSYKTGYDNSDIKAETTNGMTAVIQDPFYITYNELDVPAEYTVIPGITNTNGSTYYKTGYIPKVGDTVICYANISSNYYTSQCYLFGAQYSTSSKSLTFFSSYDSNRNFAYDRCSSVKQFGRAVDTLLKIECTDTSCIVDYATGKTTETISSTVVDSSNDIWLFTCNSNGNRQNTTYGTIYKFTIKNSEGTIVLNLVPVKRVSDSALGFFDTISQTYIGLSGGSVSEASVPTYKSLVKLSNIITDSKITFSKNNDSRKNFDIIEESEIEPNYELKSSKLEDYFWYVQQSNNVGAIATFDATYKTPRAYTDKTSNATYIVTYKNGCDNTQLTAEANNGAIVTFNETMNISYGILPYEYEQVPGLLNNNSSTYFRIYNPVDGSYKVKWNDYIECYANIYDSRPTYPCYLFGARTDVGNKSFVFYGRNTANNNFAYDRNSSETNMSYVYGQTLKIHCDLNKVKYTNGYNTWEYTNKPKMYRSFDYQDYNKETTLPEGYTKVSCISRKNDSSAYINLGLPINHNDKVETILNVKSNGTKSSFALYGSRSSTGIKVAEKTSSSYSYPMEWDENNQYWKNTNQNKNSTSSNLEIKMLVAGTLVIDVTQSSESNCDYLHFQVNGTEKAKTYGLNGSSTITLSDLKENDVIRIYYSKDGSVSSGSDTATVKLKYNDIVLGSDFMSGTYTNKNIFYTRYNSSNKLVIEKDSKNSSDKFKYDDTVKIYLDENKIEWYDFNDTKVSELELSESTEDPEYNTYLFGINDNDTLINPAGNFDIYLYSFKVKDSEDNLIRNLVPVIKNEDNTVGLYDTITNTFYTSENEDTFESHEIEEIYYYSDDCTNEMYVFGCNSNGSRQYPIYGIIYKFTIYSKDGYPVVNLIPAKRKLDGVLGFYDTVADYFITPSGGTVTEASIPYMLGGMYVSNITTDTKVTIKEAPKHNFDLIEESEIEPNYQLLECNISDYFYIVKLVNNCSNAISFSNFTYGNMYVVNKGKTLTITPTYVTGYNASNFNINIGTLTNSAWTVGTIDNDMTITISLDDYHDPLINTDDDLGIFTEGLFDNLSQYRIVNGDGTSIKTYTYISSEPAILSNRTIWSFGVDDINLLGYNPENTPGEKVRTSLVCGDDNMTEVVKEITINNHKAYEHTVTLSNQFRLETSVQYIFKVRDKSDTGKILAVSKDSNSSNLVNSDNEYYIEDNNYYFNWNEPNKYIVKGNYEIYFKINGIKI